jgi:hypothetical protein
MPEPIDSELGTYIMPPDSISTARVIKPTSNINITYFHIAEEKPFSI